MRTDEAILSKKLYLSIWCKTLESVKQTLIGHHVLQ